MKFKDENEAFEYWQNMWYESGQGYEAVGRSFNDQVDMFKDWVAEENISWNNNLQD